MTWSQHKQRMMLLSGRSLPGAEDMTFLAHINGSIGGRAAGNDDGSAGRCRQDPLRKQAFARGADVVLEVAGNLHRIPLCSKP